MMCFSSFLSLSNPDTSLGGGRSRKDKCLSIVSDPRLTPFSWTPLTGLRDERVLRGARPVHDYADPDDAEDAPDDVRNVGAVPINPPAPE